MQENIERDETKNKMMEAAANLCDAIGVEAFAYALCGLWMDHDCPPCAAVESLKDQLNQMNINDRTSDEDSNVIYEERQVPIMRIESTV